MPLYVYLREVCLLLTAAAAALAAVSMAYRRMAVVYPSLLLYFLVEVAQDLVLYAHSRHRRQYFYVWTAFQVIGGILSVAITFEMTSRLVRPYQGIAILARWFYLIATVLSLIVAVGFGWASYHAQSATELAPGLYSLNYLAVYSRVVFSVITTCTVIFMGMLGGFLLWFPIRVSQTAYQHYLIFLVYMLGGAIGYMIARTAAPQSNQMWTGAFFTLLSSGCFFTWARQLKPEEQDRVIQTVHFGPQREQQLNLQLEHINQVLLRSLGNP